MLALRHIWVTASGLAFLLIIFSSYLALSSGKFLLLLDIFQPAPYIVLNTDYGIDLIKGFNRLEEVKTLLYLGFHHLSECVLVS